MLMLLFFWWIHHEPKIIPRGIGSLNVPLSIEHYVSPGRMLLGSSWLLFFKVNKTKKKCFHHFSKRQIMKKKSHFPTWKIPFYSRTLLCFSPFHQSEMNSAFDHFALTIKSPERKGALVAEEIIHWLYKIWTELLGAETWSLLSLQWPSSSLVSNLLHFSMMFIL